MLLLSCKHLYIPIQCFMKWWVCKVFSRSLLPIFSFSHWCILKHKHFDHINLSNFSFGSYFWCHLIFLIESILFISSITKQWFFFVIGVYLFYFFGIFLNSSIGKYYLHSVKFYPLLFPLLSLLHVKKINKRDNLSLCCYAHRP